MPAGDSEMHRSWLAASRMLPALSALPCIPVRSSLVTHFNGSAPRPNRYRNLYNCCMKTTLDINDQLLANAKVLAVQQRTSLTRLIEEGLQLRLRHAANPARAGRSRIPVIKGRGGLVAGVNPLSNKSLLGALEDDA